MSTIDLTTTLDPLGIFVETKKQAKSRKKAKPKKIPPRTFLSGEGLSGRTGSATSGTLLGS